MGVITIYSPGNWSRNTQNKVFALGLTILGFHIFMAVIQRKPVRFGLAVFGYGGAIKPFEDGGWRVWRIETTKPKEEEQSEDAVSSG